MKPYRKAFACTALLVVLAMTTTMFYGCASKGKNTAGDSELTAGENNTALVSKEKLTFKILAPKVSTEVPYENMSFFAKAEERTNIHIEWDNSTSAAYKDKLNLIMASGDLPDMIVSVPAGQTLKFAQMETIIPLNELIEKNAPNLKNVFTKYPAIKKSLMTSDGKIYNVSRVFADNEDQKAARMNNPLQIREDWLKKLNLKEPVTTDDWYTVLKAFKEKDPNGNGVQDEIPFSNATVANVKALVRAWGVEDGFYIPRGKQEIRYGPIEDKFKEAIAWMAKLYSEGLIDNEFQSNNTKVFSGKVAANLVGAYRGLLGANMNTFNETLPKTIPDFKIIGTAAIKGPYGDQREPISGLINGADTVITTACKTPEAAIRWLDYFYGEEGSLLLTFGPDEKTYSKGSDGHYHYSDFIMKNPEGKPVKEAIGTFSPVQSGWPSLFVFDSHLELNLPENVEVTKKMALAAAESIPNLSFSLDDDDMRRQIMDDVQAYVNDRTLKFIMGKESMSGWDAYVTQVKSMGIEKVIKMYNDYYNTWLKQ